MVESGALEKRYAYMASRVRIPSPPPRQFSIGLTRMPSFCWVFSFPIPYTRLGGILELKHDFHILFFGSFTLLLWVFKLYFKCETTFIIRKVGSY